MTQITRLVDISKESDFYFQIFEFLAKTQKLSLTGIDSKLSFG
jgi:hypothetical protein